MIGLDRFLPDSACIKQDSTNIPRTTLIPIALKTVVIPQGDHTWANYQNSSIQPGGRAQRPCRVRCPVRDPKAGRCDLSRRQVAL